MSEHLSPELHEKIRIKAYLLWEKAGCPSGDGSAFWVEAESVITRMAKLTEAKKAKALSGVKPAAKAAPSAKATAPKAKAPVKATADPVLAVDAKPDKKKKKKKEKSDKKKSEKKKEKK